jgi:hypothetical protein
MDAMPGDRTLPAIMHATLQRADMLLLLPEAFHLSPRYYPLWGYKDSCHTTQCRFSRYPPLHPADTSHPHPNVPDIDNARGMSSRRTEPLG